MKIVMIAPTPFFSDRGCHTRILNEILPLQRMGHRVILVTYGLGRDIEGVETCRCFNFPWYKKLSAGPSVWKIALLPFILCKAISVINREKPDIVQGFLHEGAFIIRFCSYIFHKPTYFFDLQGSLTGELLQHRFIKKNSVIHKIFSILEKRINSWFPIITQSKQMEDYLLEMGIDSEKFINAMDCVDTVLFSPRSENLVLARSHGIDISKPVITYCGVLEEYQGVNIMFEAFSRVSKTFPEMQYLVIGYPNVEKYRSIANELNIGEKVFFVGKVDYDKLPEYLSIGKIAIAPKISDSEGDGKIYTYMSMGKAIVTFDRSVSREILGECGIYVRNIDSVDLADAIISLVKDTKAVEQYGIMARKRAVDKLSCDINAKRINDFYFEWIQNR